MTTNISLIDWLSFSLPTSYSWTDRTTWNSVHPQLHHLLGSWFDDQVNACGEPVNELRHKKARGNWYKEWHTISASTGQPLLHCYVNPTADQNTGTSAISITGFGLGSSPDTLQVAPVELLRKVHAMGGKLTRIDLALDYFGPEPILQHMLASSTPDVWRDRIITPLRFAKPVPVGFGPDTIYYGHLEKGIAIAAYDKAKEQGVPGPWTRIEFRTKDRELCAAILEKIVGGHPVGEITAAMLRQYLRFVPPGRKSRYNRPTAVWWEELLTAGAGFELKRHRAGKATEEGKPRRSRSPAAVLRYLKEAFKDDHSGAIVKAVASFIGEVRQAREIIFQNDQ